MGRHKIKMEKIIDLNKRQVCFSKRWKGLSKKASYLCLNDHSIAMVAFSQAGNAFSFAGEHTAEEIAQRFLRGHRSPDVQEDHAVVNVPVIKSEAVGGESSTESSKGFWWNQPMCGLELDELVELKKAMVELREKVIGRANYILEQKPLSLGSLYSD